MYRRARVFEVSDTDHFQGCIIVEADPDVVTEVDVNKGEIRGPR